MHCGAMYELLLIPKKELLCSCMKTMQTIYIFAIKLPQSAGPQNCRCNLYDIGSGCENDDLGYKRSYRDTVLVSCSCLTDNAYFVGFDEIDDQSSRTDY